MLRWLTVSAALAIGLSVGAMFALASNDPVIRKMPTRSMTPLSKPQVTNTKVRLDILTAHPLLPTAVGTPVPELGLQGVTLAPRGRALLTVGSKPAQWLTIGQVSDGVELVEVGATKAVVDTSEGLKTLTLAPAAAHMPPSEPPVDKIVRPIGGGGERPQP